MKRDKSKTNFQTAMRAVFGLSLLAFIGIAGASDQAQLSLVQTLVYGALSVATIGVSGYLGGIIR